LVVVSHFYLFISIAALPCDRDGDFISPHSRPPPSVALDAKEDNPWHPFDGRLSFDWTHYHFTELQSPAKKIDKGLNLWLAAKLEAGDKSPLPFSSAAGMYATIDSIQEGDAPFETIHFKYSGPLPPNPPRWMMETYELCTRDTRKVLHNQLQSTDFKDEIDLKPYRQFNHKGDRVWSNLMSADWAWKEAVRDLPNIQNKMTINYFYRTLLLKIHAPMVQC
jgi:hypothetical protein